MATRKAAAKKSTAKKPAAKKQAAARPAAPEISVSAMIPKMTVSMPLDDKRIAAIQRCIAKGNLTVTFSRIDLAAGKLGDGWLYD